MTEYLFMLLEDFLKIVEEFLKSSWRLLKISSRTLRTGNSQSPQAFRCLSFSSRFSCSFACLSALTPYWSLPYFLLTRLAVIDTESQSGFTTYSYDTDGVEMGFTHMAPSAAKCSIHLVTYTGSSLKVYKAGKLNGEPIQHVKLKVVIKFMKMLFAV